MSLNVGELFAKLNLDTGDFEKRLAGAGQGLQGFGKSATKAGMGMSAAITTPLVGVATAAVMTTMKFDDQMSRVRASTGATGDSFNSLRNLAKDLGSTTRFSATEAAQGMEYLAFAGYDVNEIMAAMPDMLNLASVAGGDLARTSDILTDVMSAFGLEAVESGRAADTFAQQFSQSNLTIEQLGQTMTKFGPQAHAAGMSLEEASAAAGVLADQGIKGSRAGTVLSATMRDLLNNVEDGAVTIGNTSVAVFDAEGNFRSFGDIIREVDAATHGMSDAQREAALRNIFQAQSLQGINVLLGEGVDKYDEYLTANEAASGKAQEMSDIMEDNLAGAFRRVKSSLEGLMIDLGDKLVPIIEQHLIPAIEATVSFLSGLIEKFGNLSPRMQTIILIVAAVAAAIGPLLIVLGTLAWSLGSIIAIGAPMLAAGKLIGAAFTAMLGPIGLVIIAIAALVAAGVLVYKFRDEIHAALEPLRQWIVDKLIGAWNWLKDTTLSVWEWISGFVSEHANKIGVALMVLLGPLGLVIAAIFIWRDDIIAAFQQLWTKTVEIWDGIKEFLSGVWESIAGVFRSIWGSEIGEELRITLGVWRDAIVEVWNEITGFLSDIWEGISEKASEIWTGISEFFSGVWDGMSNVASTVGSAISTKVKSDWDDITSATSTAWDAIGKAVSVAWDGMSSATSKGAELVTSATSKAWETISSATSTAWDGISKALSVAWDVIKKVFSRVTDEIKQIIVGWLRVLRGDFSGAWDAWKGIFQRGWDDVKRFTSRATEVILDTITRALNRMRTEVQNRINDVVQYFREFPNRIVSAIGNVSSLLFSIGQNIIQGAINGVKSMAGALASAARDTVSGAVSGVAGFLGIRSPSTLFADIGQDMIRGLIVGLNSQKRALDQNLTGVMDKLDRTMASPQVPSSARIGADSIAGYDGMAVNFNGPVTIEARDRDEATRAADNIGFGIQASMRARGLR